MTLLERAEAVRKNVQAGTPLFLCGTASALDRYRDDELALAGLQRHVDADAPPNTLYIMSGWEVDLDGQP